MSTYAVDPHEECEPTDGRPGVDRRELDVPGAGRHTLDPDTVDRPGVGDDLTALVARTGDALARLRRRLAAEHGLTATGLAVLDALAGRDGASHRELAGRLGLTPATLTPVVDALEQAGALQRRRDAEDRRVVRVRLTDSGRRHLETASAGVAEALAERLPRLPGEQAAVVREYLERLLAATREDPR